MRLNYLLGNINTLFWIHVVCSLVLQRPRDSETCAGLEQDLVCKAAVVARQPLPA